MGAISYIADRLANVMSGRGTSVDRRTGNAWVFAPMPMQQVEAAYRTSWLVRKIVDIPALDMTREWRDWQAEGSAIEAIEAEEKRLDLKAKCKRALTLARLYGGGAIIIGTTDADPMEPLDVERIGKGGLTYLHVMSRNQMTVGQTITDPADPFFGRPGYFEIGQQVRLHPSRVIEFVGQRAPEGSLLPSGDGFWGDPILQSIEEAVNDASTAMEGFAALIDEAKYDIIGIPDLTQQAGTAEYEQRLTARLSAAAMGKSTWRALIKDANETWEQRQVTWAGIPDIISSYLQIVSGAADIPATRLLGQSPKGLQSNGDGEERDYHAMVKARQAETLAPALDRIDDLLIRSALGNRPADIYWEFAPLGHTNEKEAADIEKTFADAAKVYSDTGLIPDDALSAMVKNRVVESGRWPGSEKAFEEAEAAANANPGDPADLQTNAERLANLEKAGAITADQATAIMLDAAPRTLYVQRKVINVAAIKAWAKAQGIPDLQDDLHVSLIYSRQAVDWLAVGNADEWDSDKSGKLTIPAGGPRVVEPLGDKTAVLQFASSELAWRHKRIVEAGAEHGYPDYIPHISLTETAFDLSKVEPYRGEIVLGPELFSEVKDDLTGVA